MSKRKQIEPLLSDTAAALRWLIRRAQARWRGPYDGKKRVVVTRRVGVRSQRREVQVRERKRGGWTADPV
jgi:hypothetical protein